MNAQKKRFVVFAIIVFCGSVALFLVYRKKESPVVNTTIDPVKKDSVVSASLLSEFFDLENNNDGSVSDERAFSGKKSVMLSPKIEYGFAIAKPLRDIPSSEDLKNITLHFKCFMPQDDASPLYVLSINDAAGKNLFWDGKPIISDKKENWSDVSLTFDIKPEFLKGDNIIALYPWNRNKKTFFVDDITVDYNGTKKYNSIDQNTSENTNFFFDFETTAGLSGTESIKQTTSHSGTNACDLSGGKEYGPSFVKKIRDISSEPFKTISMSVWVYPLTDNPNTVLTASISNSKNEPVFWDGKSTENKSFPKNKWTKINASYKLPVEKIKPDDQICVNIWNKGRTDVIVDDLEIVYGEGKERRGLPSTIDVNSIYEKRFVSEKNKPPFKTIYFEKQEINNSNGTTISSDKKNPAADLSPNDDYLVGDFAADKNGLDEVICIKKGIQGLFAYSPQNKQFQALWYNTNSGDSLWNENDQVYAGDFNNDGKYDVLLVNKKNKNWIVIDFDGNKWNIKSKGEGNKLNKQWVEKKDGPPAAINKSEMFKPSDIVYPGNYLTNNKNEYLKLNTDWRFDLKLIGQDKDGYTVMGNIDFKGYPEDHNPKYYEFVKIVAGRFISKDQTSLLIMMRNCEGDNFNGGHCDRFENLSYLPNSTQLYHLIK